MVSPIDGYNQILVSTPQRPDPARPVDKAQDTGQAVAKAGTDNDKDDQKFVIAADTDDRGDGAGKKRGSLVDLTV